MILDPAPGSAARLPAGPPLVCVVVDTEEEFDWSRPHDRANTGVTNLRHQTRAHRVFEKFGVRPTYVIDYPVASQPDGYRPLAELAASGACAIGTHLHPWVNPPFDEPVNLRNSYAGNLPPALEHAKLAILTETIGANLGTRPIIYRAGRYGVGAATDDALEALGYVIDTSVVHGIDFGDEEGPDFSRCPAGPYWFGRVRRMLEIPLSHDFVGPLGRLAMRHAHRLLGPRGRALHLPGVLARSRLAERIRLSPEGFDGVAMARLAATLVHRGQRILMVSYHSPSLEPGHTPYVRTQGELTAFLDALERLFDVAFGELGARPATLGEIHALAAGQAKP
jgi:hypothetical protein